MIGLVVVSHSRALGLAAAELASEMVPAENRPRLEVAAGLDETTFGTDAAAIAEAITAVDCDDGVLVLVDLGSAILSSQMALEFIDPATAERTVISPAPLVEGLIAALVTASTGASLEEVAAESRQALLAKQDQVGTDETEVVASSLDSSPKTTDNTLPECVCTCTIRNPHGLHARPAATLVSGLRGIDAVVELVNLTTGKGPVRANSLTGVQTLGLRKGDQMEAHILGPQADLARARLIEMADDDFGESDRRGAGSPSPTTLTTQATSDNRDPTRTGRQIAIGPARHLRIDPDTTAYLPSDPATEAQRLDQANAVVAKTFQSLAQGENAAIYAVQELILTDESAISHLLELIAQGQSAVEAVRQHYTGAAKQLQALNDPYLRARAEDQRGVERMLLKALLGQDPAAKPAAGVWIVSELDPPTAGLIDAELCQGIITSSGGQTGHGVLLAQARGFALVTGHAQAADVAEGTVVAIDPVDNQLWIDPSADQIAELRAAQEARQTEMAQAIALSKEPAVTQSGKRILVEANVATLEEARDAGRAGADGVGVVRTELLFGDWNQAPTAQEQAEIYVQIGQALGGTPITIRTWDPGGDKPIAFLPQEPEANPMLGERGIRVMRRLPQLLDDQLTAILLASQQTPVRVMLPMITTPDSMAWACERLQELSAKVGGQVDIGMMVETPAAALRAADFLDLADFISIGTNDLTQYTLAADRGNPKVSDITQGDTSAVWDLIAIAAQAFIGRPVAVCGDLASQPDATARLISLGVTELSVRPPLVGVIKQAVRATA